MGFRDELGASKERIRQLEKENAELREALDDRPEDAAAAEPRRSEPTAAEYVAAGFITATSGVAFYASMVWWMPLTQPATAGEAQTAGTVGALAAAGTALFFLCPAILGWKWEDGEWTRPSQRSRLAAAAQGVGFIVFLAIILLFTSGDGF